MVKRSKFSQVPEELKEALFKLWRTKQYSLDDLLSWMRNKGADVSRSGLHRGLQDHTKTMERYRRAQEFTASIMQKAQEGDADLTRLLSELLKTQAFEFLIELGDQEAGVDDDGNKTLPTGPMDLMLLGKMLQHISTADKNNLEFRKKVREEALAAAADAVEKTAKAAGLSKETIQQFRSKILGVDLP